MKNYEIVRLGKKSVFKTTIYIVSTPLLLMMFIGLIVVMIGAGTGEPTLFMALPFVIMPVFMLFFYGLLSVIVALVYNLLAKRFGGIEINMVEKDSSF
ncbi:MAG: hypothetical protein ACE3L7_30555 [Candidatus Pristimantibacillus sp.]